MNFKIFNHEPHKRHELVVQYPHMTIREAIAEGTGTLKAAGVEGSGLDASLLLAEVLQTSRSSLFADSLQTLDTASLAAFRGLIGRRLAGECTAYILGRKEFYGLDFLVNHNVLVPRPDTETLVEAALEKLGMGNQPLRVLDLCTGCGAVAIALKHQMPGLEVWATDISGEALATAKINAARLLPEGTVNFFHGDLFDALLATQCSQANTSSFNPTVHCIVSNPPYIPAAEIASLAPEVQMEPRLALDGGGDGLDIIRRIITRAPEFLCPGGVLLLEADHSQMKQIGLLLEQAGFTGVQTRKDLSGSQRVIEGKINEQAA